VTDTFDSPITKKIEEGSHGWIQWKASDVFIDIWCTCGHQGSADGKFQYEWKCPECKTKYLLNGHIELVAK